MPEDHFKAQELQFLYFQKVHFNYYSVNKPQIKTEILRVILLSTIILQERQAGLDYLMSILQASLLPSVTFSFTLSEVFWWELEQLLLSTTHLVGFLPGIDRKNQECDGNTRPRHPLFYWFPLTLATVAQWTTRSHHRSRCFVFLTLFPSSYTNSQTLLNSKWTGF